MRGVVPASPAFVASKKVVMFYEMKILKIACYISSMYHLLAPVAPVVVGSPQACTLSSSTVIGSAGFSGLKVISIVLTLSTFSVKTMFPCWNYIFKINESLIIYDWRCSVMINKNVNKHQNPPAQRLP